MAPIIELEYPRTRETAIPQASCVSSEREQLLENILEDLGIPALKRLQLYEFIENVFRAELNADTPTEIFDDRTLVISNDGKRVTEFTSNHWRLAEAVLGADFPRMFGPIELEHFAPLHSLRDIAKSSQILLRPVSNYLHQDEFKTFALNHGLDGYLAEDDNNQQVLESLADDLFFLSLTRPGNPHEPDLWENFANSGKGVCLQLKLTPTPASDLRVMGYEHGRTAFRRINDSLAAKDMTYIPWTLSRICAFYLPPSYSYEQEVRLLIKRHECGTSKVVTDNRGKAWPVEITAPGSSVRDQWCPVELVGVRHGPRCSPDAVRTAINGTAFADIPISSARDHVSSK